MSQWASADSRERNLMEQLVDAKDELEHYRRITRLLVGGQIVSGILIALAGVLSSMQVIPGEGSVGIIASSIVAAFVCGGWLIWWIVERNGGQTYAMDYKRAQRRLQEYQEDVVSRA